MTATTVFYGPDGLLRSGWRFAIFVLGFIFLGLVLGVASVALLSLFGESARPGTVPFLVVNSSVSLIVSLVVGWLCGKYLERLPFAALGAEPRGRWLINFSAGVVGGVVTFAIGAGLGIAFGGLSFSANADGTLDSKIMTLVVTFLLFAVAAAFEEALFRGYILQTFIRSDYTVFGVLLTSTLFATVHNANPSAGVLSWANTFIAGVWFAVAYLKTRDLWFPTGLHLAWNWTQGSIFGVEVSGLTNIVKAPLLRETDVGPTWLTGGDYGIEGGVITTIALIASTVAVWLIPLKPSKAVRAQSSEFQL